MSEAALRSRIEYLEAQVDELRSLLRLEPETNFVSRARAVLGITQHQAQILWALWPARPVSRNQIYDAVWGHLPDGPFPKIIDVQMHRLRRAMPEGVKIEVVWSLGYHLLPDGKAKLVSHLGIEAQP